MMLHMPQRVFHLIFENIVGKVLFSHCSHRDWHFKRLSNWTKVSSWLQDWHLSLWLQRLGLNSCITRGVKSTVLYRFCNSERTTSKPVSKQQHPKPVSVRKTLQRDIEEVITIEYEENKFGLPRKAMVLERSWNRFNRISRSPQSLLF